jgi:serine/threonine-protein kinase
LIRLRHPAIVPLLDFSIEDRPPWLATQYIAGSTLDDYLKQKGPLSPETIVQVLRLVLDALSYAHGEGVIHRDLKPANLMIDSTSGIQVRILDFGVAIVDRFDHEGRVTAASAPLVGTLLYMAPEQYEGQLLSNACDIYAVGLMAWEALTGPLFEALPAI